MTDIVETLGRHHVSPITGILELSNPDGEAAIAEITRLRADRNAVIRECAAVAVAQGIESRCRTRRTKSFGLRLAPYHSEITNEIKDAILALKSGGV